MTRTELENKMAVLLGGRAAEQLVYGHLSTGAADDLSKVTDIARNMVTRYGMAPAELGPVAYETEPNSFLGQSMGTRRLYGEATARDIDVAVRTLVEGQFERAKAILAANRPLLEASAQKLLATETLAGPELDAILGGVVRQPPP
jgi:cell division protease FtsH